MKTLVTASSVRRVLQHGHGGSEHRSVVRLEVLSAEVVGGFSLRHDGCLGGLRGQAGPRAALNTEAREGASGVPRLLEVQQQPQSAAAIAAGVLVGQIGHPLGVGRGMRLGAIGRFAGCGLRLSRHGLQELAGEPAGPAAGGELR